VSRVVTLLGLARYLLHRAWALLGRLGPFPVTARPVVAQPSAVARDDYALFSVGSDDAAPAAADGEVALGAVPLYLSATTRSKR